MKGVLSNITLKDEFLFDGTIELLGEKLRFQNNKKFRVEWIDHQSFKFLSNFSLGTLMVNNNPGVVECKLPLFRTACFSNFFKVIVFNSLCGTAQGIKF